MPSRWRKAGGGGENKTYDGGGEGGFKGKRIGMREGMDRHRTVSKHQCPKQWWCSANECGKKMRGRGREEREGGVRYRERYKCSEGQ